MILYLVGLLGICLWGIHKRKTSDYLSKEQITSIKGIFACIIFFSHLRQYLELENEFDIIYSIILSYIGQLMVAIFFFYSGYGIMYSYNTKKNYMETFLVNRILKTWVHFAIAILCFIVVNFIMRINYPIQTILLAFTGWEEIGNSNWFVFDILLLYIATMVSFIILKYAKVEKDKRNLMLIILVSLYTCLIGIVLNYFKELWWYNTIFCFPCGMIYYLVKNEVELLLSNRKGYLMMWGGGVIVGSLFAYLNDNSIAYNLLACCFCLIVILLTYRYQIGNALLSWCGKYSFYIYIYMRIPMIILTKFKVKNIWLFSSFSLIFTIILAWNMSFLQIKIDDYLITVRTVD